MWSRSSKQRKAALRRRLAVATWWYARQSFHQDCVVYRGRTYTGLEIRRDKLVFPVAGPPIPPPRVHIQFRFTQYAVAGVLQ